MRTPLVLVALLLVAACQSTTGSPTPAPPGGSSVDPSDGGPLALEFRRVIQAVPVDEPRGDATTGAAPPASTTGQASTARQSTDETIQANELAALDCGLPDPLAGKVAPELPLVTCSADDMEKFVLGPTELSGDDVADATAGVDPAGSGYVVNLTFTSAGAARWADLTARSVGERIAFTIDATVVSAPTVNEAITAGATVISGNFTQADAERLAERLTGR